MTEVLSAETSAPTERATGRGVWLPLGATEAMRLMRHPVFLGSLAFTLVTAGFEGDPGPRAAYSIITSAGIFFVGPFTFFAANLLASRDRRHGSEEWLSSMPAPRRDRTAAALLATSGPAAVAAVLLVLTRLLFSTLGWLPHEPHPLEVLTVPLSVLGAGLLGVMVARWLPWPGMAALVMVAMVAVHTALSERLVLLGAYVEFARWGDTYEAWAGVIDGSRAWHVIYLLALCAMAAAGALLVDARRKLPVLAVGGTFTALAVLAGWAQLP